MNAKLLIVKIYTVAKRFLLEGFYYPEHNSANIVAHE